MGYTDLAPQALGARTKLLCSERVGGGVPEPPTGGANQS